MSDQYKIQKEIGYILALGLGVALLFHIYQYLSITDIYNTNDFLGNLLYVFIAAISAVSAYYMYREVSIIDDLRKIPFIGGKLTLMVIILSLVLGIPIMYLLYKIFVLLKLHFLSK